MPVAKILIAQDPRALAKTERAFSGCDILTAFDVKAAEYWMQRHNIDVFVIGVHFDDSRGVELASIIRAHEKYKDSPIIMVRILPSNNIPLLRTTFDTLINSGIINSYVDFDETDEDAPEKIREAADHQLHLYREKVKPQV